MATRTQILTAAGIAAAIVYAVSRSERGQAVAVDVVEGIIAAGGVVKDAFTPRGIRNNNPGNIEFIADPKRAWRGQVGSDGRFGVYDTPANGVRAIGGELKASIKKRQTLEQAIHEWAPPTENDTGAYVRVAASAAGVDKGARLTHSMLTPVALAIIKHENGIQPYDPALVHQWVHS